MPPVKRVENGEDELGGSKANHQEQEKAAPYSVWRDRSGCDNR